MSHTRLRILASVFSCGPDWGSDVGVGWGWVNALLPYCDLTVITEEGFRPSIEGYYRAHSEVKAPEFHYIDVGEAARRRFWSQNNWYFYGAYRGWQRKAYQLCQRLIKQGNYDLVHQLNITGYREPGYLWRLGLPFAWGPVSGHMQMPWRYMTSIGLHGAVYYGARNIINALQMRFSPRVRAAMRKAACLVAATKADHEAIRRIHGRSPRLIGETGAVIGDRGPVQRDRFDGVRPLKLAWVGAFKSGKALHLGLDALRRALNGAKVELDVVGNGPCEKPWKRLAEKLGIASRCRWHGRLPHDRALHVIGSSDILLFTSLIEATPHVVIEALEMGVPVVCHDACGHGTTVDLTCGIKVPLESPKASVAGFTAAILRLARDPGLLESLSRGALARAESLSWDKKAREMVSLYHEAVYQHG